MGRNKKRPRPDAEASGSARPASSRARAGKERASRDRGSASEGERTLERGVSRGPVRKHLQGDREGSRGNREDRRGSAEKRADTATAGRSRRRDPRASSLAFEIADGPEQPQAANPTAHRARQDATPRREDRRDLNSHPHSATPVPSDARGRGRHQDRRSVPPAHRSLTTGDHRRWYEAQTSPEGVRFHAAQVAELIRDEAAALAAAQIRLARLAEEIPRAWSP